ncbi:MAG: RNA polymerase sigma factor [Isosphaeraceae bacterium]
MTDQSPADDKTHASLLHRLRTTPEDRSSWNEFVRRYRPLLKAWGRGWGLQEADAEDVAQAVLLRLVVKLRQFVYDPSLSFRGWLRTVARRTWLDYVADLRKESLEAGHPYRALEEQVAGDDLERRLAEAFDLELLEAASDRVRERVEPKTWEAFHLTTLLARPAREVAQTLGMPVANVFKAKSNVRKWIRDEIQRLESGTTP